MHGGGVERVVAVGDAEEARALLERLRAEASDVLERRPGTEGSVGVAVGDDVLRQPGADAGHAGQQGSGRGVEVDAHRVHAVLHDGVERARQFRLGHVVLVLADADRLRVDLDEFGQRVLEPAGDGHGPAQRHVEVGQLLRRVGRRRVHRRARLRHDDLGDAEVGVLLGEVAGELVGLARRGAVADGDEFDTVRADETFQRGQCVVPPGLRFVRVDRVGGDDLAGAVHDRHLHTGAVAGVEPHGRAGSGGRGEQQVAQVGREDAHGLVLGGLPQAHAQVDAEVQQDLRAPRPAHRVAQPAVGGPARVGDAVAFGDAGLVVVGLGARFDGLGGEVEDFLLLTAEERQDAVRRQLRERFGEVEVVGELGAVGLLAFADLRGQPASGPHGLAEFADEVGVLGEAFHEDGARPRERGGGVGDTRVGVDERLGRGGRVLRGVGQQAVRQRFEAGLPRDLGLGAALGLVGEVDVLETGLLLGGHDPGFELFGELALGADGFEDHRAPVFELPQVAQAFLEGAQLGVVEAARHLLAVTRDERHRRAVVQQGHGGVDLLGADTEFAGDLVMKGRPVSHDTELCLLRSALMMAP